MKLRDLIHYQVDSAHMTHQQKLLRLLLVFLAVMLVLTVISRAADSLTVARVTVESPKSGSIEHTAQADGVLEANREVATLALDNVLIEQVEVYQGAAVKAGDLLFQLNMQDLRRQLREKELEIQKLQLSLKEYELKKESAEEESAKKSEKELDRADEDYGYTAGEAAEKVRRARKAREDAADALDDFRHDYWNDWEDDHTLGDSGETRDGMTRAQAQAQFDQLKKQLEEAKLALRDAERAQDRALVEAERRIEDAEAEDGETPDLTPERTALEIQIISMGIEDLREAIASEGRVTAQTDGVIKELNVSTGKRTNTEASAIIAESTEGYRLNISLDKDEAKLVARGDKVDVTLAGKTRSIQTDVESITPSTKISGGVDIILMLQEGEIGQSATVNISKRGESYSQCLPIEAIHGTDGDQYVLVLDERETVLGKQQTARKVPVDVADKNETRAALSGSSLQSKDKVIVSSSKNIFADDRVRLRES